ncbi:hypothetical protein V8B97DRAFT_827850 [Scleroderma yunnanense]
MTVMNIANITTFLVANPNLKSIFSSPTNMICSTMISRLMMNIRDPSNEVSASKHPAERQASAELDTTFSSQLAHRPKLVTCVHSCTHPPFSYLLIGLLRPFEPC